MSDNDWSGLTDENGDVRDDVVPFNPFDEGTPEHEAWARPEAQPPAATHWQCSHDGASNVDPTTNRIGEACTQCSAEQTADSPTAFIRDTTPDFGAARGPSADGDIRLPDEFWQARPFLTHVHTAARSFRAHPDAVLGAFLTRVASMVPHGLKFDSFGNGAEAKGSTNLFCCLIAASGKGKTTAAAVAEDLIVIPAPLSDGGKPDWEKYRCGVGIGSGEGLIEAYMGTIDRETGQIHDKGPRKGDPVTEKVRAQTRHHAFVDIDEGGTLNQLMKGRTGSTLGGTIRSAWVGRALGQANAAAETTRHLDGGRYALGMLVGYQVSTAAVLLADADAGTPQRFLWFGAQDRTWRKGMARPPWPGPWKLPDWAHSAVITFHPDIVQELDDYSVEKLSDERVVSELDSHEPLMWCKVAALFALIDGRYSVSLEDWQLSRTLYATSAAVRTALEVELRRQRDAERAERHAEMAQADRARKQASTSVVRVARLIARKAAEFLEANSGEGLHWPKVTKSLAGRDRPIADEARDHAEAQGWIVVEGNTIYGGKYTA